MPLDFSPYQAVLLDLDGTIYHEDHPLPGAIELLRRLASSGRKFACLSNATASPIQIVERLAGMGVNLDPNAVYTAAAATADYVAEHFGRFAAQSGRRPRVYNLSTDGVQEMLGGIVDWAADGDEAADAVVIGNPASPMATPDRQRAALRLLRNGAAAVGICSDRVYPSPRGIEFGSGALTWMLAYAAGVEPTFCGKPQALFFQELCRRIDVNPAWCLLVGDNLEADIIGAKGVGMRTILTLTGVTRRQDLLGLRPELQPDLVVEDLTELL